WRSKTTSSHTCTTTPPPWRGIRPARFPWRARASSCGASSRCPTASRRSRCGCLDATSGEANSCPNRLPTNRPAQTPVSSTVSSWACRIATGDPPRRPLRVAGRPSPPSAPRTRRTRGAAGWARRRDHEAMTFETMTGWRPAAGATVLTLGDRSTALLDRVRIYACGITPYDVTHLGHATTFVWVDTLRRVLRILGVEPVVCRNVTDVDDVLDAAAHRAGIRYDHYAAFHELRFTDDMSALGVSIPDYEPRAHRYVDTVIRLAAALAESGAAYVRDGGVYFRGRSVVARSQLDEGTALRLAREYGGRPDDPVKEDPF